MAKPLILNFLPVKLSGTSFSGGTLTYEGPEKLRELREKYRDTHVLHRGGNQVYCIPLDTNSPLLGDSATFEVHRNSSLVRRLVHEALIRFFLSRDRQLISVKPIYLANKRINLLEGRHLMIIALVRSLISINKQEYKITLKDVKTRKTSYSAPIHSYEEDLLI